MSGKPFAELPDEVCFTLTETGELLNLLEWLRDLLVAAQNPTDAERVRRFMRATQRRLWGDIQDLVDDDSGDSGQE